MNYYICGAFAYPEYIPKHLCCECNPCGIPCTTSSTTTTAHPQCDLSGTVIEITTTTSTTSSSTSSTSTSTSTSSTSTSTFSTSTMSTTTTETPQSLKLTFYNIADVDLLIGGSANDIANWNTFFDLPTLGTIFTSVNITGNEVRLHGGSGITLKDSLFDDVDGYRVSLLGFEDNVSCIIAAGKLCFSNEINPSFSNLIVVNFPVLTIAGNNCFSACNGLINPNFPALTTIGTGCFSICTNLISPSFPSLITAGDVCFYGCTNITTLNFPSLITIGDYCFQNCISLTSINLLVCTALGTTVGNNGVFNGIIGNTITLTVPTALMTCNGGSPDGDIQYLQVNNSVTVIQV